MKTNKLFLIAISMVLTFGVAMGQGRGTCTGATTSTNCFYYVNNVRFDDTSTALSKTIAVGVGDAIQVGNVFVQSSSNVYSGKFLDNSPVTFSITMTSTNGLTKTFTNVTWSGGIYGNKWMPTVPAAYLTDGATVTVAMTIKNTAAIANVTPASNCPTNATGYTYTYAFNVGSAPENVNPPTDILLSNATIIENIRGSIIGDLSAVDVDTNNVFTYELVSGTGDTGNSNFKIVNGNQLQNVEPFDFETQSSYSIRIKVNVGGGNSFEKIFAISVVDSKDFAVTLNALNSYCSGSISINPIADATGVVYYSWIASNGGVIQDAEKNTNSLTNLPTGTYTVTVSDDAFSISKSVDIEIPPQYQNLSVCYVTSDDTDATKNRIFINNQGYYNVDYYEILKETNISNYYTPIGTIPATEISFLDTNSNNTSKAYRYEVRTVDSCGKTSPNSDFHGTILLQSSVAINNTVNLSWNNYEGLSYGTYNIYRRTNLGSFELIDSIASTDNTYNDTAANVLTNGYEYYISIDVSPCATSVAGKQKSTVAIKSNHQMLGKKLSIDSNILSSEIILYPNPSSSKVVLKMAASLEFNGIEMYNTLGQKIKDIKEKEFSVDFLPSGAYLLKIVTNQGTAIKHLIKK